MRRSGTIARQALLVRVGRRPGDAGRAATATRAEVIYTGTDVVPHTHSRKTIGGVGLSTIATTEAATTVAATTEVGRPGAPFALETPDQGEQTADDVPLGAIPASVALLPGVPTAARRASFALVNACTLSSLALGLLAIFVAMRGDVRIAAACLVACVAFDGLDGALARKLGVSSPFGAQMDSLADMCSFGLAAPVVVYASLVGSVPTGAAAVACMLVAGCAAVRLARFNISPKDGTFFCGVPTTLVAAVLALAVLIDLPLPGLALLGGVALLAFAMVSSFPYVKLARLVKLPPWLWLLPIVGALIDARLTFALLVVAYLLSGPVLWLRTRHA